MLYVPLTYYGGKQRISSWIIKQIPDHIIYCEPFAGGAAILFKKPQSKIEIINDLDSMIYNFYKQLRDNREHLYYLLDNTLYSRQDFLLCYAIHMGEVMATNIEKARATYVVFQQSFAATGSGWAVSRTSSRCKALTFRYKTTHIHKLSDRIKNTHLECLPWPDIIKKYDTAETFFYLDPPYPKAIHHYKYSFTIQDFNNLCSTLKHIKGKFALSFYEQKGMTCLTDFILTKESVICITGRIRNRTEVLAKNYKVAL